MTHYNRFALLLAAAAVSAGPTPAADAPYPSAAVPAAAAGWVAGAEAHLHVYILDGANPLGFAGVEQLADRLRRAGFPHTKVSGWYAGAFVEREIRDVHAADPTARFAVVGYSAGTYAARTAANRLVRSGVPLAAVAYIGGDYLTDTPETRVPGAGRVVNIMGGGYLPTGRNLFFNGTNVTGAHNVRLPGTWHYGLPTNPATFATLYAELAAAAGE